MKLFNSKIIAIANQKGGVGKTTTAVNVASYLSITETPTLLIDMDPQANCTSGFGVKVGSYKKSVYDVIIGKHDIEECILNSKLDFLDILPGSPQLVGAEIELVGMLTRERMLKDQLNSREVQSKYKYIAMLFIDYLTFNNEKGLGLRSIIL